ncbi:MAG: hypothetical protein Q9174_003834 [Haloplaca sp. 1 TL-2023]
MSYPPPAGGQPPSFKTNVNRAKTKRWVEAKSYTYDGDDWGEADEYGEYGGYDEPPPPPRPTGLRQRGQSVSREQQGVYQPGQSMHGNPEGSQHGYPGLGRQGQPQQASRSVTNPPYQTPRMARPGSFDQGDERRAFSAAHPHQPVSHQGGPYPPENMQTQNYTPSQPMPQNFQAQAGPPGSFYGHHSERVDPYQHQESNRQVPVSEGAPPAMADQAQRRSMGSRTQSMSSNTSATDFHSRRDFSPSAVPPPLSTRGSPSPHNRSDPQSGWRPPRKSSLSQSNQSDQPYGSQGQAAAGGPGVEEGQVMSRERASSGADKPLPFVRPADIYKRMHEEKERQRQSQDSSRPSMDAIMGEGGTTDQLGSETERAPVRSQDAESTRQLRSPLDPVAERKSEYGMTGFPDLEAAPKDETGQQQASPSATTKPAEPSKVAQTLSPQLPDLARMSGFGELFGKTSQRPDSQPPEAAPQASERQPNSVLQHQPSFGLRSVVHQAFDTTNDPMPETPASSTAESSIGRSGSGGTSVVSPIISRGPSSATTNAQPTAPLVRPNTPPNMDQQVGNEDRPISSGSLGTPKAISRKLTPDLGDQRPGHFMPGHRRDLSTPSPDNSPARTPAVEAKRQLQQPQEAELAMTTPIETGFPQSNEPHESAAGGPPSNGRTFAAESTETSTPRASRGNFRHTDSTNSLGSLPGETPKSPAESSRSRVRNLADKFESGRSSPAGSERAPSPVKSSFAQNQMYQQSRPLAGDRLESFRPKLPGGWESSASLAPLEHQSKGEPTSAAATLDQRQQDLETDREDVPVPTSRAPNNETVTADRGERGVIKSEDETSTIDPFSSLAAAGSALANAFSGMGSEKEDHRNGQAVGSPDKDRSEPKSATGQGPSSAEYRRAASGNMAFMPEASKPNMLATPDDVTSSIMPTPLDKMPMAGQSSSEKPADYFATKAMPKQQWSGDSYATGTTGSFDRPDLTPALSVDTGPQYESDRLRREIIRELSPRLPKEPSRTEPGTLPSSGANTPAETKPRPGPHESMVLPREYDSYWQGSGSERSSRASSVRGPTQAARDAPRMVDSKGSSRYAPDMNNDTPPIVEPPSTDSHPERPDMTPHRFSWEGPAEVIPPGQEPLREAQPSPLQETRGPMGPSEDQMRDNPDSHPTQQDHSALATNDHSPRHHQEGMPSQEDRSSDSDRGEPSGGKKLPASSGLAGILQDLPPSAAATSTTPEMEKGPIDEGSQHFDSENEPQSRSVHTTQESQVPSAQPQVPPKIQSFREILAMKDPKDRIRAYDESRMQFANMDTGLSNWLAITTTELPEHKEVLPHGRLPGVAGYKPSPSRSKLGGLFPSGNSSAPQPYFQQYLNASSPTGTSGGTSMPRTNSTSGYSPANSTGKLSSQQMQARGKDLLHTAGVFGGKANVAAKGLFSKGKTRFRGGNADKAPLSTFNTTHKRGMQPQPELVSPISPNGPPAAGGPEFAKQLSRDSRPISDLSEYQDTYTQETPYEQVSSNDYSQSSSSHDPIPSENSRRPESKDERQPPYEAAAENNPEPSELVQSPHVHETLPTSRLDSGQSPHSSVGHNRTPTQADYADYFRRGSSPSVQVPKTSSASPDSRAVDAGDPIGHSRFDQHLTTSQTENILRSKYSTQDREGIPLAGTGEVSPDQKPSSTTQGTDKRESIESRETFATAPSKVHKRPEESVGGAAHDTSDEIEDSSIGESTEDGSSSNGSAKATTPVAVPAANIQDRPGGRPFSFIQFLQNPTPAPLEDYSYRKPSVDSNPGQIDPEQDAPPSPMSASQPVVPGQPREATAKNPVYRNVRHDFPPDNPRRFSGSPSRSFSRPFSDASLQGQATPRQERSVPEQEDMPVQHYPAAIPRQEMVHPRQQANEYSLEGVGPPPVPRTATSRSTSKRGSRSSVFFRSFKSPTESAAPALPGEGDDGNTAGMSEEPRIRKSKSRRSSLFRSLTKGSKASSTDDASQHQQKLPENPQGLSVQSSPQPPPPPMPPPDTERDDAPADLPSKYRNRLSKPTTGNGVEQKVTEPKAPEQKAPEPAPPGKKKRFSGLGSLFGKSKDPGRKSAQMDRPAQIPEQHKPQNTKQRRDGGSRISSTTTPNLEQAPSANTIFKRGSQNQYTRDSLAREGLLPQPQTSRQSSRSPEPSAYHQDAADRQQALPPRHQSLGHRSNQGEQRPSQWMQQYPSSSSNTRHQTFPQSQSQQRTMQSTVTTRSGNQPSGYSQPHSNPRHFSSTVTTTTTSGGRMPNTTTTTFQSSKKDVQPRSESPPPPPPPPKDAWRRPKPQQQRSSTSNTAPAPASGDWNRVSQPPTGSTRDPSLQTSTSWNAPSQPRTSFHSPRNEPENIGPTQHQPQQSLPPLETKVAVPSGPVPQPRIINTDTGPDPEARKLRRSQIESMGSPRATENMEPPRTEQAPVSQRASNQERKPSRGSENDDEPVVMSATSFPGQEWQPSGYRGWDEY